MLRLFALMLSVVTVSACTNPNDLHKTPTYLGLFDLGHNVVVAPNLTRGPVSREASEEEWISEMTEAISERFDRYDGGKFIHLGISIEGYVLAIPGVPIVASPKSALIINVTAWDDAANKKLNEKPKMVTVLETYSASTVLGSGLTQSKEKQMYNLTRNASKQIQNWLVQENKTKGWFEADGKPTVGRKKAVKVVEGTPASAEAKTAVDAIGDTIPGDFVPTDPEVSLVAASGDDES